MKNTLSILILNWKDVTNPTAGGGTYYTHRVAEYLVKKGHEVTLLCPNYSGGKNEEVINGVNVIRLGNRYTVYLKAFIRYLKTLKGKYDLVIDEINVVPWFTPLYVKAPKMAFIHQTTKEPLFLELNKLVATIIYCIEKIGLLLYRNLAIVTVSPSVKKDLMNNMISGEKVTIIPPGIDLKGYDADYNPYRKADFPMVLYFGRLKKYKGIHHLIKAMKYVTEQIPEAKLLIAGKGDYRDELTKLAKKLGLERVVTFLGYVPDNEKISLMRKAWLLVIPSIKEGYGIVAIEAAASGTPVIGTDTTGLSDSIIKGRTGYLVPYEDPKAICRKICEVLTDDELRHRLSKNASEWGKRFEWKTTLSRFEEIVRKVAATNVQG